MDVGQAMTLVPAALPAEQKDDDELYLGQVMALLRRRSRLALSVAALIFALGGLLTLRQRIFNPIYQGSFRLLVTDPISEKDQPGGGGAGDGSALQELALRGAGSVSSTQVLIDGVKK